MPRKQNKNKSEMSEKIFECIQAFIVNQVGVDEAEVTRDTSLQNDLGIYGGDATDFFISFGKEFSVDVSEFMAADYFKADGLNIFSIEKKKKPLTVGHLEKAVIAGRLDEETINS
jgi:acyl carrier protein